MAAWDPSDRPNSCTMNRGLTAPEPRPMRFLVDPRPRLDAPMGRDDQPLWFRKKLRYLKKSVLKKFVSGAMDVVGEGWSRVKTELVGAVQFSVMRSQDFSEFQEEAQ